MNKKRKQGLCLMIFGFILGVCAIAVWIMNPQPSEPEENPPASFEVGNYKFTLEELVTDEQRIKGLSGRESLEREKGMLFVFDEEGKPGIWMKDMKFPISIIWLDSECKVTGFKDIATPESYPEVFYPQLPSKYVIETNPIETKLETGNLIHCNF